MITYRGGFYCGCGPWFLSTRCSRLEHRMLAHVQRARAIRAACYGAVFGAVAIIAYLVLGGVR